MITILWEYEVKAGQILEFRAIYAPDGKWAKLFKKAKGFVETQLLHSVEHPQLFVTIDQWESLKDYKAFLSSYKKEYERLDRQCQRLTERESCLGTFGVGFNDEDERRIFLWANPS